MHARLHDPTLKGLFAGFLRPEAQATADGLVLRIAPLDPRPWRPALAALGLAAVMALANVAFWGDGPGPLTLALLGAMTLPFLLAASCFVLAPRWLEASIRRDGVAAARVHARERGLLGREQAWVEPLDAYDGLYSFTEHWGLRAAGNAATGGRVRGWLVLRHAHRPDRSLPLLRAEGREVEPAQAQALADALGLPLHGIAALARVRVEA